MDKWKWTLLIFTVVLFLLPAAIEWRNSKHGDKRTKAYRRITNTLLVIWILSCLGIALAMYKDFSRKEKSPEFTPYLNGILIKEDSFVTIPETNDTKELVFSVMNTGDWPADSLNLVLFVPEEFNVISSEPWIRLGNLNKKDLSTSTNGQFFSVRVEPSDVLAPLAMEEFLPLKVQTSNLTNSVNLCTLFIYAKNADKLTVPFQIHFTNGIGNQHSGF